MSERERKTFPYRELAEVLVKHAGIHEGHWALFVEFGLGAANMPIAGPDGGFVLKPTAVVPVNMIGVQKFDEPSPLSVDAAQVNPRSGKSDRPRTRSRKMSP